MDGSTPHEARPDAFPLARKGYDRRQVDAYREKAEARVGALEQHIKKLEDNMTELGLAHPTDLAAELDVVGEEVKRILQEARVAAEQMRSRAADDAARWRAEADEESRALRESSRSVAYEARRSAWETGSEMLASAVVISEVVATAATERALFTQAEAEREASRVAGDARRERDESVGSAREEAEGLVAAARQESESIMSNARRQADAAQERARALELRRAELMTELETARATIAGTEATLEPDDGSVEPAVDAAETVAVVEEVGAARSHWPDDAGSVKIVSAARVMSSEPVDADAMVAEIEAMRREPDPGDEPAVGSEPSSSPSGGGVAEGEGGGQGSESESATSSVPPTEERGDTEERSDEAVGHPTTKSASSSSSPSGGGAERSEAEGVDEIHAEPSEPTHVPPIEGRGDAEERSDEAGGHPTPEPEPEPVPKPDPLAGLFAQLKDPADAAPSTPDPSTTAEGRVGGGDGMETSEPSAPSPRVSSSPSEGGVDAGDGRGQTVPAQASETVEAPEPLPEPALDPFALRERHLLPVQNRVLRSVKRSLVEAQNQALEDLRLVDGWTPDESIVAVEVSEALSALARESMVAGFAAAAEMMDTTETPQPDAVNPGDPSSEFSDALIEAAQGSVTRSRGAGAGHREIASALSRVFRSWRTDEAERRVQFASRSAYHIGVTAALADLGATVLEVAPSGRPCLECPANKGPWTIADGLPSGTVMPPSRIDCACAVVPSR